jgi:hypothetical protein
MREVSSGDVCISALIHLRACAAKMNVVQALDSVHACFERTTILIPFSAVDGPHFIPTMRVNAHLDVSLNERVGGSIRDGVGVCACMCGQ